MGFGALSFNSSKRAWEGMLDISRSIPISITVSISLSTSISISIPYLSLYL